MAGTGEEVFSRDFLCLIGKGDAPPPEQGSRQQPREDRHEEVDLNLALSVGDRSRFALDTKGDKLPQSSSVTAVPRPPVEVPAAALAVPRASGSPSSASSEGVAQRLQDSVLTPPVEVPVPALPALPRASSLPLQAEEHAARLPASGSPSSDSLERQRWQGSWTLMRTSSLPAATDAAGNEELKKDNKEAQSLKRQEVKKKMIERRNSACSTAFKGTAGTEEQSSSSSVPSSREATRRMAAASPPLPPSSLAPRTAAEAALGSSSRGDGDQSILGSRAVAAARANSTGDDVGRLMQEMPAVHTRDLPNGARVNGFLYKYREAEDVRIVCICHGRFFTPSEFVEHAGGGKVDHPLRHIAVSTNQTL